MRFERISIHPDYKKANTAPVCPVDPYLDAYLLADPLEAKPEPKKRDAVIVVPGGGYHFVSPREGDPIAAAYMKEGCQTFVLHYSTKPEARFPMALMELAEAVHIVRSNAALWDIDPDRIFLVGFSAGGHLAASLSLFFREPFLLDATGFSAEEIRPDGCILGYPVISSNEAFYNGGSFRNLLGDLPKELYEFNSLEDRVTDDVPPFFIWSTMTDKAVPIENTLVFAQALRAHHADAEIHIFRRGPHGLALATEETAGTPDMISEPASQWIGLSVLWMKDLKNGEKHV